MPCTTNEADVSGFSGFGDDSVGPYVNTNQTWQFVDNFSLTKGNHSFRFGYDSMLIHLNGDEPYGFPGSFSFGLVPDTWSANQLAYQLAFRYADFNGAAAIAVDLLAIGLVGAILIVTRSGLFRAED